MRWKAHWKARRTEFVYRLQIVCLRNRMTSPVRSLLASAFSIIEMPMFTLVETQGPLLNSSSGT